MAWPKNAKLIVLDELRKQVRWKNYLKGLVDEFQNKPPMLVTGSARLDVFRHEGDALTGRYYLYRLHPIDLAEAGLFMKKASAEKRLDQLVHTGWFPEPFLNPADADRLRNDRFDLVVQEELCDLDRHHSVGGLKHLIELLREGVGRNLNYTNLAQDLSVTPVTIKRWVGILEMLYIIFLVTPYAKGLARSLRKEPKVYFYDCAAAYSRDQRPVLKNVVASALLKYCHCKRDVSGRQMDLHYFRDREKREVDFVITEERKVK